MDRGIVYPGAIPLDTDLLNTNRNAMIGLGALIQAVLGTSVVADGLAVAPTAPASMSVTVAAGSITQLTTVDASAYGSLSSSTDALVKMGVNTASTTLGPLTAPATSGQSIVYLVQAAFSETDDTPVVLPYYNASNPSSPYTGPAGAGTSQNTRRRQSVALNAKAGIAATTGAQVAPSPDPGYVGLYEITIAYGASSIVAGNIVEHPGGPFLPYKLPSVAPGFSTQQVLTSSGTFTVPNRVTRLKVRAIGGGGGGGGAQGGAAGGGGGAGAYCEKVIAVTPGQTISYTIGAQGAAGSNSGGSQAANTGGAGGNTTFSTVTAGGGSGGQGGYSGTAGNQGTGGTATGGTFNVPGGPGAAGLASGSVYYGGFGGGSFAGSGGAASSGLPTSSALPYGAGGAGGGNTYAGEAGAIGVIIVEY